MDINVEYRHLSDFSRFFQSVKGKKVAIIYDVNTAPYALSMLQRLKEFGCEVVQTAYPDEELVPTEEKCEEAYKTAKTADYLLAVGSGTLNDMAKSVSTRLQIPCGVLATAASMDGYCSKGAALMRGGVKVTDDVHTPSDILIDLDIVRNAPKLMTAAGFGDIIGKFTCLTDWQLSNAVNDEPIHAQAFAQMESAREACISCFDALTNYDGEAIAKLMDALITAGLAMAECGNSRPASGSEHHQSHFLEMDFVRRGEKVPLHGLKVAIGTLVSITLYNYLKDNQIKFKNNEKVFALVEKMPSVDTVRDMLIKMGCPVRFSAIGVRKETMEEMIEKAYTVRNRYTVLTLIHDLGLTEKVKPILMENFY